MRKMLRSLFRRHQPEDYVIFGSMADDKPKARRAPFTDAYPGLAESLSDPQAGPRKSARPPEPPPFVRGRVSETLREPEKVEKANEPLPAASPAMRAALPEAAQPPSQAHKSQIDRLIALATQERPARERSLPEKPAPPVQLPVALDAVAEALPPPLDAQPSPESERIVRPEPPSARSHLSQGLGMLRGLIPVVSGALQFFEHPVARVGAQLLPMLDRNPQPAAPATTELEHTVSALQAEIHRDTREVRLQLQDQTVQMRRVEEQITRMREAAERNALEHSELVEDVKSLTHLVRTLGATLAILLVLAILMAGFLLFHTER